MYIDRVYGLRVYGLGLGFKGLGYLHIDHVSLLDQLAQKV